VLEDFAQQVADIYTANPDTESVRTVTTRGR